MKKLYLLTLIALPLKMMAQPTITSMENYTTGITFKYMNCDSNVTPGASGAAQTWNFTSLVIKDSTILSILNVNGTPYASQFPTASLVQKTGGSYVYTVKTGAASHTIGLADSTTNLVNAYTTNTMLSAQRPITYGANITDTFLSTITLSPLSLSGGGTINIHADGWGQLQLPNKNWDTVLRVKLQMIENDSATFPPATATTERTAYLWFANAQPNPILIWDSIEVTSTIINTTRKRVSYFKSQGVAVDDVPGNLTAFKAAFLNNTVLVSGFEAGKKYELALFNLNGQQLYNGKVVAGSAKHSIELNNAITPGIYFVMVKQDGMTGAPAVIKLVKD